MSTSIIFLALIIIVCFLLVVAVMVQNPKGGGLSSSFGGGGGAGQQMGGVKKTGDFLDKSTWTLATALLVLILLYNVSIMHNQVAPKSRIMNENPISAPAANEQTAPQQENSTKTVTPTKSDQKIKVTPKKPAQPADKNNGSDN